MFVSPTGIAISFAGSKDGGDSRPVVARIVGFADDNPNAETIVREMVVPAGEFVKEDLPHGLYNVQLTLPSGRIIQRNVTIDDASDEVHTFFEDFAPSSGFSLQEAAGRAGKAILTQSSLASGNTSAQSFAPPAPVRDGWDDDFGKDRGFAGRGMRHFKPEPHDDYPRSRSTTSSPASPRLSIVEGVGPGLAVPAASEPEMVANELRGDAALWRIEFASGGPPLAGERRWARTELPDGRVEIASLPLPWFCSSSGNFTAAQVLVDPARGDGAATTVAIIDQKLAGLLAYLDRGQAGSARPLLEQLERENVIENAIRDKMANPLAACAAAYVGLAVYDPREREVWDQWLGSCMARFPDVPDAAIVHARRLILRPNPRDGNAAAAAALVQACRGGIPYFSAGAGLLREMLTLLAGDHRELAEQVEWAVQLAGRVDATQAFTVLRYAPKREAAP
jgi:hypothetical protein